MSQTTVSFVLNNTAGMNISEETRQRVLQACQELNYFPDMSARALARGHSNNLALVLIRPHERVFADPYLPNVITGINRVTQRYGYRILVEQMHQPDQDIISALLRGGEAAGALISGWFDGLEPTVSALASKGYPIVLMGQPDSQNTNLHYVEIDHLSGVRALIRHLIARGHRRIACITYAPISDIQVGKRLNVYHQTLREAGLPVDERLLRFGAFDPESGCEAALSLLDEPEPPSAIYGMNDLMALGAMSAIRDRGLDIPADIAVVGYDDMRFSRFTFPPLTTVRAPEIEVGECAGEMMISLIQQERYRGPINLSPELVVRMSCGGL